ncbi:MAG TPA: hypothetical protein VJ870_14120 [Amycolatopsis sp.]|nr:hypothetical protein [Amycolatopsis sp.]
MSNDGLEDHPELMDPDWQRHAEKEAWTGLRATRRRRRRATRVVVPLTVLVILAGAGYGLYRWGKASSDQYTGDISAVTPTTTAPTDLAVYAKVDLDHPFNDTPAQNWAEGIAGLTAPPTAKVGTFTAQQTATAVDEVKQAINVAALDPATLVNHQTDKYLALFAPDDRDQLRPDVADPDHSRATVTFLADGYHLLPAAPRINGVITLRSGERGELLLHVSYVVAYAFDPGNGAISGPSDFVAFQRFDSDYAMRTAPPFTKASAGLWLDGWSGYTYSMACDAAKKGYLTPSYSEHDFTGQNPSVTPGVFDPNQPAPTDPGNCN